MVIARINGEMGHALFNNPMAAVGTGNPLNVGRSLCAALKRVKQDRAQI